MCTLPTIPVTNVVPATLILVETLHGPHTMRAVWEGQAWRGRLICVVNIEERHGQRQRHWCPTEGFCPPLTARDDLRAICGTSEQVNVFIVKSLQGIFLVKPPTFPSRIQRRKRLKY